MSLIEVLGSTARLQTLRELSDGPMYVSELADAVGMDGSTAVHHLEALEEAGLIEHYNVGNRKYYELISSVELYVAPPPERSFILQSDEEE
jgi:DNA-binding transcriptional ArsR family regulator